MADNNQPATKQDLAELRVEVARMHDNLVEKMRDMQTEVLRAFAD